MQKNLKKIRQELGLSVAKFADKLNMSASTLTGYERGERTPSWTLFTQLYKNVNTNINWFVSGEGLMFRNECENTHILVKMKSRLKILKAGAKDYLKS